VSEISDVFNKGPTEWTLADAELAIAYYAAHRDKFTQVKKDGIVKRTRKPKAKPTPHPHQIDLVELLAELAGKK
jgi:hypothetical protein